MGIGKRLKKRWRRQLYETFMDFEHHTGMSVSKYGAHQNRFAIGQVLGPVLQDAL